MKRNLAVNRIKELMLSDIELLKSKNNAYSDASKDDFFNNFKKVEEQGITSLKTGILVRCSDKISRMINLIKNPGVSDLNESVHDTIRDLTNYLYILRLALKFDVDYEGPENTIIPEDDLRPPVNPRRDS